MMIEQFVSILSTNEIQPSTNPLNFIFVVGFTLGGIVASMAVLNRFLRATEGSHAKDKQPIGSSIHQSPARRTKFH